MPSDPAAKLLRSYVREHNISVLAASGAAAAVAAIGWGFLYVLSYWVAMITTMVNHGMDARPDAFTHYYLLVAGGAIVFAMFDAWFHRHEEARDERSKLFQFYELLLFFPRITVAMVQNFTAWAWLPSAALPYAVRLLGRLRTEHTIPLHVLPLDFPNHRLRRRVLTVLEVTQLTDIRTEKGQLVLRWSALAPEAFRDRSAAAEPAEIPRAHAHEVEKQHPLPPPPERPFLDDRYEL